MPGGPERRPDDPVDGLVDHRVGHHDHMVLGAAERLHALAGVRGPLVDDPRDRGRPDERHRVDPRVLKDPLDHLATAVDEIDDARRQIKRVELCKRDLLGQRHLLGGLEYEAVTARDRERQEPERHHRREVERHDRRAHADRLADRLGVDVARDVLEVGALHRRRDRARALHHLDHARDLGASIGERLAHLGRHRPGEIIASRDQPLAQLEQLPRPPDHRDPTPLGQRRARGRHGRAEVGRTGQRHPRQHLPVSGVGDIEHVGGGGRRRPAAGDVVIQEAGCDDGHEALHSYGTRVHS